MPSYRVFFSYAMHSYIDLTADTPEAARAMFMGMSSANRRRQAEPAVVGGGSLTVDEVSLDGEVVWQSPEVAIEALAERVTERLPAPGPKPCLGVVIENGGLSAIISDHPQRLAELLGGIVEIDYDVHGGDRMSAERVTQANGTQEPAYVTHPDIEVSAIDLAGLAGRSKNAFEAGNAGRQTTKAVPAASTANDDWLTVVTQERPGGVSSILAYEARVRRIRCKGDADNAEIMAAVLADIADGLDHRGPPKLVVDVQIVAVFRGALTPIRRW